MYYAGLDVHLHSITVCVLDEDGKAHQRATMKSVGEVAELLNGLPGPCQVCYEASTGYGFVFEALEPVAERVVVAHPGQLRLIFRSKSKNDRADALKLGAYFGLVLSQDQSGKRNRLGRITREGSATVRHLVVEAVWRAVRNSPTVRAYLERIQRAEPVG